MRPNWPGIAFVVSIALAVAPCAWAGTIELVVRDENGAPVARATVALRAAQPTARWTRMIPGESDAAGRITFAGIDPGQYKITLTRETAKTFVPPDANPRVAPPRITLAPGEERVRAELELWRGVPVYCGVDYDGRATPTVTAHFREVDTGTRLEQVLPDGAERFRLLLPGRWEIWIDPPPGFLLIDVGVNGRSVEGSRAFVELMPGDPPAHVTWYYSEPAQLYGKVTFAGEKVGVTVAARLVEPGPWIEAARIRGGSVYETVQTQVDNQGNYEMVLPDGRWEVQAVGAYVAESDPEVADLAVTPGETKRQDFEVRDREGGSGVMAVRVEGPRGERVSQATVEVWPLDPDRRLEAPTARAKTRSSYAWIRGVPAGDWIVGAALEGYVEGTVEVPGFDPEDRERGPIRVRLRRGASVHVVVHDEKKERVPGVKFGLERLDDAPETVVRDPELLERLLSPQAESDTTGHAWIRGIWPGRYRLQGRAGGRLEATRFVRFREGDRLVEALDLDLRDEQETEVEAALVPAARVTGHLVCSDGRPMPGIVSLVAVVADLDPSDLDSAALVAEAELSIDHVPLRGPLHDEFAAGPLEQGFYFLGFRPEGYERWTWAPGEEHPAAAVTVQAAAGDPTNVGTLEIDCGPAIRLAPRVATGDPLPDLRKRPPREETVTANGTLEKEGTEYEVRKVTVDFYRDHVIVRGLPEGTGRIDVTMLHRFFRPGPRLEVAVEAGFDRGRVVSSSPVVQAVGGALRVSDPAAAAVRVTSPEGAMRIGALSQGHVEFPSLAPGTYGVELCTDTACAGTSHRWPAVEVQARQLQELARRD